MKKLFVLVMIVLLSIIAVPVYAEEESFVAGDDLKVEEKATSTAFIAGNTVEVTSEIDGAAFIAGNLVDVSSTQDYLFAAGNSVTIDQAAAKDAFIAGNVIRVKTGSFRDLYVAGSTITIDANINRNAYLAGDSITINGEIYGDVYAASEKIKIGDRAVITGTLHYPKGSKLDASDTAQIANKKEYKDNSIKVDVKVSIWDTIVIPAIISYVSLLVVAFVLLWLHKKSFDKYEKTGKTAGDIFKRLGIGLGALILIPIACIMVLLTIIGIPLSLIVFTVYCVLIYLSMIPTAYYFGNWAFKDKIKNKYLLLAVSLLILSVVKLIPFLGGWVGFLSLCFGLGMFMIQFKESIKLK